MGTFDNCIKQGCANPGNCEMCGFDRREEQRRRALPLKRNKEGKLYKNVSRRRSTKGGAA